MIEIGEYVNVCSATTSNSFRYYSAIMQYLSVVALLIGLLALG